MTAVMPPPGKLKAQANIYLKALRAAKGAAYPMKSPDFLRALEREVRAAEAIVTGLKVPRGSQRRDTVADYAAGVARSLIDPDPYRHPENRNKAFPDLTPPWRRPATLTYDGPWLVLASLIYEAATGIPNRDMMKACREVDKVPPSHVVEGLTFRVR